MATNTYVALDTKILTSAVSSVTFSPIPQGYTDLVLVVNAGFSNSAGDNQLELRLNSDTGSNYSVTSLSGDGSSASSARQSNNTWVEMYQRISRNSLTSNVIINLMNYSNTTTYKTILARTNAPDGSSYGAGTGASVNLWRSTAAINSISVANFYGSNTFLAGSTFTIYGIANADNFVKATGGIITEDASYTYHTFGSSGTFTPKQSLTADILMVAGGGGGGMGGGGGGGVITYTGQSLTATNYTIGIGGGGTAGGNGTNGTQGTSTTFTGLTTATGGGYGAGAAGAAGGNGGSGGGGRWTVSSSPGGTGSQGSNGGAGWTSASGVYGDGGGGGFSQTGGNGTNSVGGKGGDGISTYSSWGSATGIGQNVSGTYWYAGGGGGGADANPGAGGSGGGSAGVVNTGAVAATANTGGGGGGSSNGTGAAGGSGVVIIRYPK